MVVQPFGHLDGDDRREDDDGTPAPADAAAAPEEFAIARRDPLTGATVSDAAMARVLPRRLDLAAAQGARFDRFDLERILGASDLVGVDYLARGLRAARPVARLLVRDPATGGEGTATGFLVAPRLLLTNRHVLPDAEVAGASLAEFGYELDEERVARATEVFRLRPEEAFVVGDRADDDMDFALVAVAPTAERGGGPLARWGHLRLDDRPGKIVEGEWITVVQHPGGAHKAVALRENRLVARREDRPVLVYETDTAPGSSGAPCFNDQWQVVALHSRGVPRTEAGTGLVVLRDGRRVTEAALRAPGGRFRDADVEWVANLGVRVSRILRAVRADAAARANPLVAAMLEDGARGGPAVEGPPVLATEAGALVSSAPAHAPGGPAGPPGASVAEALLARLEDAMEVLADGLGGAFLGAEEARRRRRPPPPSTPARPRAADDLHRGYRPDFLGADLPIPFPLPGAEALRRHGPVAPDRDTGEAELAYTHFSTVQAAERRLAYATAVNIDGAGSVALDRGRDRWRFDPRLAEDAQAGDWLYKEAGENFFDRGHLVRRRDPCWGPPEVVLRANDDTFHWTNCAPQHWSFNQGATLWNGLEDYILDNADADDLRVSVFTGPVFREDDVVHRGVPVPREYWKVVAVRDGAGRLRTAAYTLSQAPMLERLDFEALPVGRFRTFQRPVARLAALTGLAFPKAVLDADAMAAGAGAGGGRARPEESGAADAVEIRRLSDVVLGPPPPAAA